jgi:hypothetical protein|tara:strand:- start:792 stop:926 length:135 start_codon:yes stop_codon:yes gene_type:complete
MSKGSNRRPTNEAAFAANFDKIFGKPPIKKEKQLGEEEKKKAQK